MSESELENIKEKMFYCDVNEDSFVFEAGEFGHCFFIVEKGILELLVNGKFKKELKPQDGTLICYHRFWRVGPFVQHSENIISEDKIIVQFVGD